MRKWILAAIMFVALSLTACMTPADAKTVDNAVKATLTAVASGTEPEAAAASGDAPAATPTPVPTTGDTGVVTIKVQPTRSDVPAQGEQLGRAQCPNPRSKHVGSGIAVAFKLSTGYWHINQACAGCGEGIEENFLILYDGPAVDVVLPEGSVWWYAQDCFVNDLNGLWQRSVRESTDDFWPQQLPSWLSIVGVTHLQPLDGLNTGNAPLPTPQAWVVAQDGTNAPAGPVEGSDPNEPVFAIQPGVVVNGNNQTVEVSGWCAVSWHAGGPEYVTAFLANEPTVVGPFNGSLSCWPNRPPRGDIGNHDLVGMDAAMDAGINFSPAPEDYEPR